MLKEVCGFFQDHFFPHHLQSWCLFEVCGRVEFVSLQFLSLITGLFFFFSPLLLSFLPSHPVYKVDFVLGVTAAGGITVGLGGKTLGAGTGTPEEHSWQLPAGILQLPSQRIVGMERLLCPFHGNDPHFHFKSAPQNPP